jgi:hypothetical protein
VYFQGISGHITIPSDQPPIAGRPGTCAVYRGTFECVGPGDGVEQAYPVAVKVDRCPWRLERVLAYMHHMGDICPALASSPWLMTVLRTEFHYSREGLRLLQVQPLGERSLRELMAGYQQGPLLPDLRRPVKEPRSFVDASRTAAHPDTSYDTYLLRHAGGGMPWREARLIGLQLLQGIADLERIGVVHTDIKPDNVVMLNGRVCRAGFEEQERSEF